MCDKGFPLIENDLVHRKARIVMPPFKRGGRQFTQQQNREGYNISSLRIHVECAISRMKNFAILQFLEHSLYKHIDMILHIVAFLVNNFPPLVPLIGKKKNTNDDCELSLIHI